MRTNLSILPWCLMNKNNLTPLIMHDQIFSPKERIILFFFIIELHAHQQDFVQGLYFCKNKIVQINLCKAKGARDKTS